jgi:hypothetical protein
MVKKYEDKRQYIKEPLLIENIKNRSTENNSKIILSQDSQKIQNLIKIAEKIEEKEKNISQKNEKENNSQKKQIEINEMKEFLSSYCKDFNAKFELLECLKSGSAGTVYSGKLRNNPNSKLIAFKFLIDNIKEIRKVNSKEKSKKKKIIQINISKYQSMVC